MTIEDAIGVLERSVGGMADKDKHRAAGAMRTLRAIMGHDARTP